MYNRIHPWPAMDIYQRLKIEFLYMGSTENKIIVNIDSENAGLKMIS